MPAKSSTDLGRAGLEEATRSIGPVKDENEMPNAPGSTPYCTSTSECVVFSTKGKVANQDLWSYWALQVLLLLRLY
jgi:hypothetical protein